MSSRNTINELEALKRDLLDKVKQVDLTISLLKSSHYSESSSSQNYSDNSVSQLDKNYSSYNKNDSFRNKVVMIMKEEQRFLHVREIAEIIHQLEPDMSVDQLARKISPVMSYYGRNGSIVKIKVGRSNINSFWGSESWLDKNGEPKPEHKYNDKYIVESSTKKIEI